MSVDIFLFISFYVLLVLFHYQNHFPASYNSPVVDNTSILRFLFVFYRGRYLKKQ